MAFMHLTVRGYTSTRPYKDEIAVPECRKRHLLGSLGTVCITCDTGCVAWQQFGEFGESSLRLADGAHLDPMTEQHDGDEGCQLFPERHARVTQCHHNAENKSDADRERNQRHHARKTGAQFANSTLYEWQPPVGKHDGAEHGRDPV